MAFILFSFVFILKTAYEDSNVKLNDAQLAEYCGFYPNSIDKAFEESFKMNNADFLSYSVSQDCKFVTMSYGFKNDIVYRKVSYDFIEKYLSHHRYMDLSKDIMEGKSISVLDNINNEKFKNNEFHHEFFKPGEKMVKSNLEIEESFNRMSYVLEWTVLPLFFWFMFCRFLMYLSEKKEKKKK